MVETKQKLIVSLPSDREIMISRVFDAPRHLVFKAHSSCEHMQHWWGPRGTEFASCEIDFKPSGRYRIVHTGEGPGEQHGFRGEFLEIVEPERIAWTFEWEAMPGSHLHADDDPRRGERQDNVHGAVCLRFG